MHIETTNYGHRWHNRRTVTATDSGQRPSSWSSNSVKSRALRKPPVCYSQSVQSSSFPFSHSHVSHSLHEFSPLANVHPTESPRETVANRFPLGDDFGRRCFNGLCDISNLSDSTHSHSLTQSFMEQSNLLSHRQACESNGPDPLPPHIVLKLKERFEKRVLHHHHHHHAHQHHHPHAQTQHPLHSHSNLLTRSGPDDNWIGYKSIGSHSKSDKYQLVAAFLVNKGNVEAWHIYAPLPVDVGQNSDDYVGSRMLELTQRRLRLIQRYYSGARQYVVLYVNSSYAEHYLPLGLVHDPDSEEHCSRKRTRRRESSHSDIFHTGHRLVNRIFSTMRRPQRQTGSMNGTSGSNTEPVFAPSHNAIAGSVQSELNINETSDSGCLRRNKSLPPYSRASEHQKNINRDEEFGPNSGLASRSISQTHGSGFFRRIFEHIWTSYARPTSSKSVNFVLHRKASSTGQNDYDNTRSTGAISETNDNLEGRIKHEDTHEKESSSSGLIDFSSSTGSTTSDQLAFVPPDAMVVSPAKQETRNTNCSDASDQPPQIWLPKQFETK